LSPLRPSLPAPSPADTVPGGAARPALGASPYRGALLGLLLIGHLTSTAVHQEAAGLLLHGPYAAVFWVCVIGLGILLPLLLQHLELLHRIRHTIAPSVLVLCGGLVLRFVIVAAGQASHWSSVLP